MAALCGILTLSHQSKPHHFPFTQNPKPSSSNLQILQFSNENQKFCSWISRRDVNLSFVSILLSPNANLTAMAAEEEEGLERYSDGELGFTLLVPSSYIKVDKAGASALFEEVNKGSNNVGVVVNHVRLTSLKEFGTPQFVADKLILAEKRKSPRFITQRPQHLTSATPRVITMRLKAPRMLKLLELQKDLGTVTYLFMSLNTKLIAREEA